MQISTDSKNQPVHRFDSLAEFLDATVMPYSCWGCDEFYNYTSLAKAKRLAVDGWSEGLKTVNKFKGQIESIASRQIAKQELVYDVTGLDFDMGCVMSGEPECWYDFSPKQEQKVIRIAYGCGVSGSLSQDMIATRGALICCLIDLLEQHEIRVELDIYLDYSLNAKLPLIVWIPVKNASQPLDLDRVSFLLMNAGFNRTAGFSYYEQALNVRTGHIVWADKPDFPDYDLIIERGYSGFAQYQNAADMVKWLQAQLKTFGVNMTGGND